MASRPVPEFNKFESLDLVEALKNAAQDAKHEKAGFYKFAFETLRGKINEPNEQFRNFLLPLLGDKDQEKVLDVVAKVEKNNRHRQTRQNPGGERKAGAAPYSGVRCFYCNRFRHVQAYCFRRKREMAGSSGFFFIRVNPRRVVKINRAILVLICSKQNGDYVFSKGFDNKDSYLCNAK